MILFLVVDIQCIAKVGWTAHPKGRFGLSGGREMCMNE